MNACYSRQDAFPPLLHLILHKHMDDAKWLIKQNAKIGCLLRWNFIVDKQGITTAELYTLLKDTESFLKMESDDFQTFNLLHYVCYFGDVETFNTIMNDHPSVFTQLANGTTYDKDTAMTIALLSPRTTQDVKVYFARHLYGNTSMGSCNKNQQNPAQIVLLMGKVGLLFSILLNTRTIPCDSFNNKIIHLAIKAQLPTVGRYSLRYTSNGINDRDIGKDTILTLAVKAGEEDLACEILRSDPNIKLIPNTWNMANSEKDYLFHQVLKREMQDLACDLCRYGDFSYQDTNGDYPLHIALSHGLDRVVEALITHSNSSIDDANSSEQDTPLHLALKLGYYGHSRLLIEKGASVNKCNRNHLTPLHILVMVAMNQFQSMAKKSMNADEISDLLKLMLQKNPDVEIPSGMLNESIGNETCLHMAIRGKELTENLALEILAFNPKLVFSRDCNGDTPLLLAVKYQNLRLVQVICQSDSDELICNRMNKDSDSPLHIAVRLSNLDIVCLVCSFHM